MEGTEKNNWLVIGDCDDKIYQYVSVTAFDKLTCNEFIPYPAEKINPFDDNDDDLWADFRYFQEGLNVFLKEKNLLEENTNFRLGMNNKSVKNRSSLLWQGSSEKTAEMFFDALTEYSVKSDTGFIVNYYCAQKREFENLEKKPLVTFHPEIIMNGKRLVNDIETVSLNRTYLALGDCKLQYITDKTNADKLTFTQAQNKVCKLMLSSLNHYFGEELSKDVMNVIANIF